MPEIEMPPSQGSARTNAISEQACIAALCLWLLWIPLPFGSNVPWARLPLIGVPLFCCMLACVLRVRATARRSDGLRLTTAWGFWSSGAILFLLIGALQLLPLPASLHRVLEPESFAFWESASQLAVLARMPAGGAHPLTLDPATTLRELLRVGALFAAFTTAALLVRTHPRRLAVALTFVASASFQSLYGVREAALQRYAIWGWLNRLVHGRVTGTFVNPNHFAHYLAITLPMSLFLIAAAWRAAGSEPMPVARRIMRMLEVRPWLVGTGVIGVLISMLGMMLAQSRGALLALAAGTLITAAVLPGRRLLRVSAATGAGLLLLGAAIVFLGSERTVERFAPTEGQRTTLVGRTTGFGIAARLWQRFPLIGTGLGTFPQVASIEQKEDLDLLYNRAHNDYLEIAATTGTLGAVVAIVALFGGTIALIRMTFGRAAADVRSRRRSWQVLALMSLFIAMVHALVDFNFFIPANPATLAVILGAAVAPLDRDKRMRR